MVWYSMLCYAMLCYVTVQYGTVCYSTVRYSMPCYGMLCYAMLCCSPVRYMLLDVAVFKPKWWSKVTWEKKKKKKYIKNYIQNLSSKNVWLLPNSAVRLAGAVPHDSANHHQERSRCAGFSQQGSVTSSSISVKAAITATIWHLDTEQAVVLGRSSVKNTMK